MFTRFFWITSLQVIKEKLFYSTAPFACMFMCINAVQKLDINQNWNRKSSSLCWYNRINYEINIYRRFQSWKMEIFFVSLIVSAEKVSQVSVCIENGDWRMGGLLVTKNLVTGQFGNQKFGNQQFGNLTIWSLDNLVTWQFGNLTIW